MSSKYLKLNTPCTEKWENMAPNDTGQYCTVCAKTVTDFTQLSQRQIAEQLRKSKGSLCARLTRQQLEMPLPEIASGRSFEMPYQNVAAGLMIAATLAATPPAQAEPLRTEAASIQAADNVKPVTNPTPTPAPLTGPGATTTLKGKIVAEKGNLPIEGAKVTLVTISRMITAYTSKDGSFSLQIPNELIDDDNVIRVTYQDAKDGTDEKDQPFSIYEAEDLILSKKDMAGIYGIKAKRIVLMMGGIGSIDRKMKDPIVLSNGKEVSYTEFSKALMGKRSTCNLENKDYMYFSHDAAVAIYGPAAQYGLYILMEK